jgi:hypothetical protein
MFTIYASISLVPSIHRFGTYQDFVLCKLGYLGLLAVCSLDTEQSSEKEVVDFELGVNVGEMSTETEYESDKTIRTTQSRINACADT